ncbi:acid-sensing ion channel 4-B-like [Tubulanus polymorphus]|uniref:acid-sensing ion channel 4-B-like n=1 Tax=Tubulanus polymorphus TaxID=672921 RepID=UPI003DA6AF34
MDDSEESWQEKCERYVNQLQCEPWSEDSRGVGAAGARPARDSEQYSFCRGVRHLFLISSAHGLPYAAKTRWAFTKLIWVLIFLCGCTGLGFLLYKLIDAYLTMESKFVQRQVRGSNPRQFPSITLCNYNPFQKSALKDPKIQTRLRTADQIAAALNTTYLQELLRLRGVTNRRIYSRILNRLKDDDIYENVMDKIGFSSVRKLGADILNSTVVDCEFLGGKCSESDFEVVTDMNYGNCITYKNKRENVTQNVIISQKTVFNSIVDLQTDQYLNTTQYLGIRVYIHRHDDQFYAAPLAVVLTPGKAVSIAITEVDEPLYPPILVISYELN